MQSAQGQQPLGVKARQQVLQQQHQQGLGAGAGPRMPNWMLETSWKLKKQRKQQQQQAKAKQQLLGVTPSCRMLRTAQTLKLSQMAAMLRQSAAPDGEGAGPVGTPRVAAGAGEPEAGAGDDWAQTVYTTQLQMHQLQLLLPSAQQQQQALQWELPSWSLAQRVLLLVKAAGEAVGATAAGAEAASAQLLPLQQTLLIWRVLVPLSHLVACLPLLLAVAQHQQLLQLQLLQVAQQASRLAPSRQRTLQAAGAAEARAEAGVPLLAGAAYSCTAAVAWALSYRHQQQPPVLLLAVVQRAVLLLGVEQRAVPVLVQRAVLVSKLPVGVAGVAEAAGAAGGAGVLAGPSA
jgi:hypothetical protein